MEATSAGLSGARRWRCWGRRYSANAWAHGLVYQNCNQWLGELLADWPGARRAATQPREHGPASGCATQGYRGDRLPAAGADLHRAHRLQPLAQPRRPPRASSWPRRASRSAMPAAIEAFVQPTCTRRPSASSSATRRPPHGACAGAGQPIADGCVAAEGDEVTDLT
ncbi:MAG: DUF2145 domain-containing protein [Ideonella sp. WA131b]|nr:DUF2145 domain-containing protein [Ideonella sp. WA131b]